MGSGLADTIRQALVVFEQGTATSDYCATFDVADRGPHGGWVQVVAQTVNFAYPHQADPLTRLTELGIPPLPGQRLVAWEAGKFATIECDPVATAEMARFVELLLSRHLSAGDEDRLDVTVEDLAGGRA